LNYYKQRRVIAIFTNIARMLYICNASPVNMAKYGAWQVLRHTETDQTKPDQSSHMDKIATAVDLSQNDQIQSVAETSPVLYFSAWTSVLWQ